MFSRWKQFYNGRRLHERLDNKTPAKIWEEYIGLQEQLIMKQDLKATTEPLCTNGERKSLQFEESRLCIKTAEFQPFADLVKVWAKGEADQGGTEGAVIPGLEAIDHP